MEEVNIQLPQQGNFLFIDAQDDLSMSSATSKQKRAFLQREFRRKQKEASTQRLKSSIQPFRAQLPLRYRPAPTNLDKGVGPSGRSVPAADDENDFTHTKSKQMIVRINSPMTLVSQAFTDPFASSAVEMTSSLNSYFDHCMNQIPPKFLFPPLSSSSNQLQSEHTQ
jgi:hypothetical protein